MIHYELLLLYGAGLLPKDVIKIFGYSRGTAYSWHRKYRLAGKRLRTIIESQNSVLPTQENKAKNLGARRVKTYVSGEDE